tara:strand:+ start:380 stop:517 length:138 start_codon:yes stop_codon:yes gene_type:complete
MMSSEKRFYSKLEEPQSSFVDFSEKLSRKYFEEAWMRHTKQSTES